ncbi:MAG: endonuclease domain-containing protein [Solirubrobacterales bacterium]
MAAVLVGGEGAILSHASAGDLLGLCAQGDEIEISIPLPRSVRRAGIRAHRRRALTGSDVGERSGIPVTSVIRTLIDLAPRLSLGELERAVNETDRQDLASPEAIRRALEAAAPGPGVGVLRKTLDRRTFRLTDSELERRFIPIARGAGLPMPLTRQSVNGHQVDFHWPSLGLVIETDGLRYHRTPAQQARDRRRDQAHTAAGMVALRFTHEQVRYEPAEVTSVLHE